MCLLSVFKSNGEYEYLPVFVYCEVYSDSSWQKSKLAPNIESINSGLTIRSKTIAFVFLLLTITNAWDLNAQTEGIKSRLAPAGTDSLFLDSLPVISSSIAFSSTPVPPYELVRSNTTYILFSTPLKESTQVNYEILNLDIGKFFRKKDTNLIQEKSRVLTRPIYESDPSNRALSPFRGLNSKGSISRSISIGNNQDAVLNSSLNLQLSGNIGSNTQLRASITDNSLPVQADGYTQQLREFDKVYIELENKDFGLLRAGDYNMTSVQSRFLRFDKRISGAGLSSVIQSGENTIPLELQGGIVRGRFARNTFQGQEGNQGPYKLNGANGENFIIIISGSERVYIDGILRKRGQQFDYTIDYNAGEITFTALQPITKERRIVVEFQYTEQNYLRSAFFTGGGFASEKFKINAQFYNEQDSKNQPISSELTDAEQSILAAVGDRLEDAVISTIQPSEFRDDVVLYELRDSLGFDSVLVFSSDSTRDLYFASFSFLGNNQGNYTLEQNNANGRVFRWVPPSNGIPQGQYEPVKQLIAPNRLQILTLQSEIALDERQRLRFDLASSRNDLNSFSDLDDQNNSGAAGLVQYQFETAIGSNKLNWNVDYEFNQDEFRTVERIRRVEFSRDWNIANNNINEGLQLVGTSLRYGNDKKSLGYDLKYLQLDEFSGFKNTLSGRLKDEQNTGHVNLSLLTTSDTANRTTFIREDGQVRHFLLPQFWAGLRSIGEWNLRRSVDADTLNSNSYSFFEYNFFLGAGDTAKSFGEIGFLKRLDDTASFGRLRNFSEVNSFFVKSRVKTKFNGLLNVSASIRNLKVFEPVEKDLERTTISRLSYTQRLWKSALVSTTLYETGSGTEARRSFSYVEVPAGTGTYTHTDYNGNGIKELDEFEVAPTSDLATYVRVFTPSNEFIRTNLNKFGQNLNINAPSSWKSAEDMRRHLSRFSTLLSYQLDRKTLLTGSSNELNPFKEVEDDSLIVSMNNSFRGTLFFNRTTTKFGIDFTHINTDNRSLLSFGVERRSVIQNIAKVRYQIIEDLIFRSSLEGSRRANSSDNFSSRNFSIDGFANNYELAYQANDKLAVSFKYNWSNQNGSGEESSLLNAQLGGMEFTYNAAEALSLKADLNYISNSFEGNSNNPAGFEMLQGLRPGNNGTWNLTLQRTIRKNILLSVLYNGRLSENIPAIHTGSFQIKAIF